MLDKSYRQFLIENIFSKARFTLKFDFKQIENIFYKKNFAWNKFTNFLKLIFYFSSTTTFILELSMERTLFRYFNLSLI